MQFEVSLNERPRYVPVEVSFKLREFVELAMHAEGGGFRPHYDFGDNL